MKKIDYPKLIAALKSPHEVDLKFWRLAAEIERSIPRYNNRYSWWERIINFCNTYIIEQAVEGNKVSIAGLWTITLELDKKDSHDIFYSGERKDLATFYFEPTKERTDLKVVSSIADGLSKYCNNSKFDSFLFYSLLFYCLDTGSYYMIMKKSPEVDLKYCSTYTNSLKEKILYYKVNLPSPELLSYTKPVSDEEEQAILEGLPEYVYIKEENFIEENK